MVRHTVGQDGDKYRMLTHLQWNRMVTEVKAVTQTVGQNGYKYRMLTHSQWGRMVTKVTE